MVKKISNLNNLTCSLNVKTAEKKTIQCEKLEIINKFIPLVFFPGNLARLSWWNGNYLNL